MRESRIGPKMSSTLFHLRIKDSNKRLSLRFLSSLTWAFCELEINRLCRAEVLGKKICLCLYLSLSTFPSNFFILIFSRPQNKVKSIKLWISGIHYIFFRYTHTHTPFHVSVPWLKHECGVFHRNDAIFRLNCRKSAALINGQEAENHSAW